MESNNAYNGETESLPVQREYQPDRQAMLAALRVVLGLPRVPSPIQRPALGPEPEA
jgi:hypothetical protein